MAVQKYKEIYMPSNFFTRNCGVSEGEWRTYLSNYSATLIPDDVGNYPVGYMFSIVMSEIKEIRKADKIGREETVTALDREKVLEFRIKNQQRLGSLIRKSYVKQRVFQTWAALRDKMMYAFKNIAQETVGNYDAKNIETIMVKHYNKVVSTVDKDIQRLSFDEDGDTQLLRTRVMQMSDDELEHELDNITDDSGLSESEQEDEEN